MTNNTVLYWDIDGQSLHTYAWSISTRAGSRGSAASKRGDDLTLPHHPGHLYQDKTRDPHFPQLPMWIQGLNQDGTKDNSMSETAKLELNWQYLLSLFNRDGQFALTKRFYDSDGTTVLEATAMAELLDPPDIEVSHLNLWKVAWDLKLADPHYYADEIEVAAGTITVEGTARTNHVILEMAAGTLTFPDGNYITYTGSGTAEIDCQTGLAMVGSTVVNGLIERNRHFPDYPQLSPGSNAITGSGTIRYEPAYW